MTIESLIQWPWIHWLTDWRFSDIKLWSKANPVIWASCAANWSNHAWPRLNCVTSSKIWRAPIRLLIKDVTFSWRGEQSASSKVSSTWRKSVRHYLYVLGELEDRGESATSECNSDSDFEKEENQHIKSRLLPAVLEIKTMVNDLRERQNERDVDSIRSICSNSTLSLNNLNQKVQESKRLSRNIQVNNWILLSYCVNINSIGRIWYW